MTSEAVSSRRKWSIKAFVERTLTLIGLLATLVGLTAGGIALLDYLNKVSTESELAAPWVERGQLRNLENGESLGGMVVAPKIVLKDGTANIEAGAILVADALELGATASLRGTDAIIIARRVTGGRVDFSGKPGSSGGQSGAKGGTLLVVTSDASVLHIDVSGGDGARGADGDRGSNGRNGRCDGFGRYRGAAGGGNGKAGGNGGNGGDAGLARVLTATHGKPTVTSRGGSGGSGGAGGPGGQGGRGCVGLGGSQSNAQAGSSGRNGSAGNRGADSAVECYVFSPHVLREMVGRIQDNPDQVREKIEGLVQKATARCGLAST